jgi:serine protease Do
MANLRFIAVILMVLSWSFAPNMARTQQFDEIFQNFRADGLAISERRYLQAALAFEGHYVGLLDGDWGKMSQTESVRSSVYE